MKKTKKKEAPKEYRAIFTAENQKHEGVDYAKGADIIMTPAQYERYKNAKNISFSS